MTFRWRTIPPARDPVAPGSVLKAAVGEEPLAEVLDAVRTRLRSRYAASSVVLTRSGTDALTLALRIAARLTGTSRTALPAYGCYAVATAAVGASARSEFYDLDPATLAADPGTVREALERGAGTLVVAHLYGHPAADRSLLSDARDAGALLVEDAAQGAGGRFAGRRLGTFGDLTVLSFGRGKGLTSGGGGALLVRGSRVPDHVVEEVRRALDTDRGGRASGWSELGFAAAQWVFGRPALYRVPSSVPFLGLGETRYREPTPPEPIADRAARLLREALSGDGERDVAPRRRRARRLDARLDRVPGVRGIRSLEGAEPGALRFPFRLEGGGDGSPALGVLRGYPRLLPELGAVPHPPGGRRAATPGAAELRDTLHTAPTHPLVEDRDLRAIVRWAERRASAGVGSGGGSGGPGAAEEAAPREPSADLKEERR